MWPWHSLRKQCISTCLGLKINSFRLVTCLRLESSSLWTCAKNRVFLGTCKVRISPTLLVSLWVAAYCSSSCSPLSFLLYFLYFWVLKSFLHVLYFKVSGRKVNGCQAIISDGERVPHYAGHSDSAGQLFHWQVASSARCVKESYHRSFLPASVRLYNQYYSQ